MNRLHAVATFASLCAGTAAAQGLFPFQIQALVKEGDVVAGVGAVTTINNLAINDLADWLVQADTNQADTNTDEVMLRSGLLYLREGDPLAAPAGATIGSFDAVNLSNSGHSAWNIFIDNTGSTSTDSAVFYDTTLQIQESTIATASGFSAGTPYIGWFEVKPNDTGSYLMVASVDDVAITSTVDRALVLGVPSGGGPPAEAVLWKEGDVLPGQIEFAADFGTGPHTFAINDTLQVLFFADLNGDTTKDGVLYLGTSILAQEGSASPIAGRNWLSLSSAVVDLNDAGDTAFTGSLDGDAATNVILIRNGQKLAQEGDTLPAIAPFKLTGFGSAPIQIDAAGNVLWFGDWDDPDTTRDTGLFLNGDLLVQEGVTTIGGVVLQTLAGVQNAFSMSDDGRFILFEGALTGSIDGAFLISPAGSVTAIPGCVGNAGTLALASGTPSIGQPFTLASDVAQVSGALSFVGAAGGLIAPGPCGVSLPGLGEVFLGLSPAPLVVGGGPWSGAPVSFALALPSSIELVGANVYFQGLFLDLAVGAVEPVRLTNGLDMRIGGP
ncbi:MAG: hypothetical protein EPO68_10545 [Planctomycetota bacterium]|nr:MAG: hypothetical protein EPO68_10545 [Planctomycetota bacterium]